MKGVGGGRIRPNFIHGCVGFHVPHNHVGRCSPRRNDGHPVLLSSRYRRHSSMRNARGDRLRNFNLSVLVTDAFMDAVENDLPGILKFDGTVYRTVPHGAYGIGSWRATYDAAEPGVIFIDRVNALNNLAYCETITRPIRAANSRCPPMALAFSVRSISTKLVRRHFTGEAELDEANSTGWRALPCGSSTTSSIFRAFLCRRRTGKPSKSAASDSGVTGTCECVDLLPNALRIASKPFADRAMAADFAQCGL